MGRRKGKGVVPGKNGGIKLVSRESFLHASIIGFALQPPCNAPKDETGAAYFHTASCNVFSSIACSPGI